MKILPFLAVSARRSLSLPIDALSRKSYYYSQFFLCPFRYKKTLRHGLADTLSTIQLSWHLSYLENRHHYHCRHQHHYFHRRRRHHPWCFNIRSVVLIFVCQMPFAWEFLFCLSGLFFFSSCPSCCWFNFYFFGQQKSNDPGTPPWPSAHNYGSVSCCVVSPPFISWLFVIVGWLILWF